MICCYNFFNLSLLNLYSPVGCNEEYSQSQLGSCPYLLERPEYGNKVPCTHLKPILKAFLFFVDS